MSEVFKSRRILMVMLQEAAELNQLELPTDIEKIPSSYLAKMYSNELSSETILFEYMLPPVNKLIELCTVELDSVSNSEGWELFKKASKYRGGVIQVDGPLKSLPYTRLITNLADMQYRPIARKAKGIQKVAPSFHERDSIQEFREKLDETRLFRFMDYESTYAYALVNTATHLITAYQVEDTLFNYWWLSVKPYFGVLTKIGDSSVLRSQL